MFSVCFLFSFLVKLHFWLHFLCCSLHFPYVCFFLHVSVDGCFPPLSFSSVISFFYLMQQDFLSLIWPWSDFPAPSCYIFLGDHILVHLVNCFRIVYYLFTFCVDKLYQPLPSFSTDFFCVFCEAELTPFTMFVFLLSVTASYFWSRFADHKHCTQTATQDLPRSLDSLATLSRILSDLSVLAAGVLLLKFYFYQLC